MAPTWVAAPRAFMHLSGGKPPWGPVRARRPRADSAGNPAWVAREEPWPSRLQAFEAAALVHLDSVYRLALRLCRKRTEAEDLVQDTYLRAFSHFDQFQPGTNCRAWLFTILRNAFINRVTRGGREVLELDEDRLERVEVESPGFPLSTIANPEDEFFRHVVDKDVAEALDQLPVLFREVVLLADLEQCSYKEIGQICGVPVGTVMSRLSRGRQRLRAALATRERRETGTP